MKIAICFSGQMRTAVAAAPNIRRFIGDLLPDIDFFIHTWDINEQKAYGLINGAIPEYRKDTTPKKQEIQEVTQKDIYEYTALYNPKVIRMDNFELFQDKMWSTRTAYQPPLFYSWRKSVLYCMRYSIECNLKYDVVIKLRPDIVFSETRRLSTEIDHYLNDTTAFYCNNASKDMIDDVFWLSSPEVMFILSNFGDPYLSLQSKIPFRDFILFNNINIKSMICYGYAPVRPETLEYDVLTEFDKLYYYDQYWYSSNEPFHWSGE